MSAHRTIHEPRPPQDPDSPLAFSMEGYQGRKLPAALIPYVWAPAWNSGQSINKFQDEIGGPLHGGDPGVRLIEPGREKKIYFAGIPPAEFNRPTGYFGLVRLQLFLQEALGRKVDLGTPGSLRPAMRERILQEAVRAA